MRIGIFTLHSNTNFGGGLQQIALFEVLESLGHEPQVVCVQNDAKQSVIRRIVGVFSSYSFMGIFRELKARIFQNKIPLSENTDLYKRCDAFNYEKLNYTPKFGMAELPEYCKRYDAIIVGSDQVWTDVYSKELPYFCDGIGNFKGRIIAYAACSVHEKIPFYNRRHIQSLLSRFSEISVRDITTAKLVESVGIETPKLVADPTVLFDYNKYIKPIEIVEPYIFAYVLGTKTAEWHAQNIAHIRATVGNIKVIAITTELNESYPWADEILTDNIAVEWMNLLYNARFIYTNSYHAVLFSLKFHKEFVAYYGDIVRSSRMIELIKQFGLSDRIVKNPDEVDLSRKIHYISIDNVLHSLKNDSLSWLSNSLKKV